MEHLKTEFMWNYQHHFRNGVELDVNDVLARIGMPVDSKVLLVGFATDPDREHQICVEPETGANASRRFANVTVDAQQRFVLDPESEIVSSNRHQHDLRQQSLWRRHRGDAVAEMIQNRGSTKDTNFSCRLRSSSAGMRFTRVLGLRG